MKQKRSSRCTILLGFRFQIILILSCRSIQLLALDSGTDRESLLAFKSSVLDPRDALSGWNRSVSHCIWVGVSCSGSDSRVTALDLRSFGISGTIPPHLSNLTSLEKLNLFNNSFHGEIPANIGNLSSVKTVILAGNSIIGKIPSSLSLCLNLEQISFENNQLSGSLPPELGNLHNLRILSVAKNNLTGEIPINYGNLYALTTLAIAENKISGELWDELRGLRNLMRLDGTKNGLTGELPLWLFNISSLGYISLTDNNLSGKLPSETGGVNITGLRELYLADNRIGGTIPSFIFNSSNIQRIDLSSNQFTGRIPIPHDMKELVVLNLGDNKLSSTTEINAQLFDSLTNSTELEILYLESNLMSGELPDSIGNLSLHLQQFCLDNNFLSSRFPDVLGRYKNLSALSIYQNSFSGNFPISIGEASRLQRIQAHQNMFSGEIPESFGNLSQLFMLTLGINRFLGSIPTRISACEQMNLLGLRSNELSGNIPREIFRLSILGTLILGSNKFTGPIPSEVGSLEQLEILDVSGNRLSGSIPVSLGQCSSLQNLDLSRNELSGQIRDALRNLRGLASLNLSYNNITGTIPLYLENLVVLKTLNLSFNNLEGQVPRNGVFVDITWDALQGNGDLCGSDREVSQTLRISMCLVAKNKKHHLLAIFIPVSISVLLLVCAILWLIKSKRNKWSDAHPSPLVKGFPMKISYEEIRGATDDFSSENFIGKGGFGSVYRGTFASRIMQQPEMSESAASTVMLAVKVIDLSQSKALKSFIAECDALKQARHRNLVKVITSCSRVDHTGADFKALVMEFVINGNLENWLYSEAGEGDGFNLGLMQRVTIAIDVAFAVEYLHSDCDPPIVHCDLKPGNVLLDENLTARVGDFGLARFLACRDQQEVIESSTVGLKGSIGYIAPEYGMGGRASKYGDVYSFGILLLEIVIAKKPTDRMFQEVLNLDKFSPLVNEDYDQVLRIVDPRLLSDFATYSTETCESSAFSSAEKENGSTSSISGNVDRGNDGEGSWSNRCEECVVELIGLGLSCARQSPKDRPPMKEVLKKLHEVKRLLLGLIEPSDTENVRRSASV